MEAYAWLQLYSENDLRLTKLKLGLVINFGEQYVKNGIQRVVNGLELRAFEPLRLCVKILNYEQRTKTHHCGQLEDEQDRRRGAGAGQRPQTGTREREGGGHRGVSAVHRAGIGLQGHSGNQKHPARRAEHEREQFRRVHRRNLRRDAQGIFRALRHPRPSASGGSIKRNPTSSSPKRRRRPTARRSSRLSASAKRWRNAKAARWKRFWKRRCAAASPG